MTATSYVDLNNDDLGANKILRAATMSALDTNPRSIAQRGTGAPWLNGIGAITAITSGSGNWTVPAGVYRVKVAAVGGGGGAGTTGSAGSAGGDTTFNGITAGGGGGGAGGGGPTGGTAGSASGGDINLAGEVGNVLLPERARSAIIATNGRGGGIAAGGSADGGGGSGGTVIKVFSVAPGDLLAYAVGAAGAGGSGVESGTIGIIIIEY